MRIATAILVLLTFSAPALAQKSYTPAQLRSMIASGKFPAQGSATSESKAMDYSSCVSSLEQTVSAISGQYPTATIANTSIMRSEKVWSNDGAMTITCSAPDRKMTLTTAKYR